ncbi:MAG: DNA topoisomerase IV [Aureibaculum sp.]|nr:DNA topoisomerase IV [Aureibaculum sp.]
MKKIFVFILVLNLFVSCKENNSNISELKTGTFKTFLEETDVTSLAIRNDSIQIETYNNIKDTFAIKWQSNFEYVLTKINPKNELDSTPFHVKITGIKDNSYTFKASYKGSNFKQKGEAIKLKD